MNSVHEVEKIIWTKKDFWFELLELDLIFLQMWQRPLTTEK